MGMYVTAFAMVGDQVLHHAASYRNSFYYTYCNAPQVETITTPERLRQEYDQDNPQAHRMSPAVYLRLAKVYRAEFNRDYSDEAPMYVDDATKWLSGFGLMPDCQIVLVTEI